MTCEKCLKDITAYYDLSAEIIRINTQLLKVASWHAPAGKILAPGRVVLLRDGVSWIELGATASLEAIYTDFIS